jgi:hypothetical protein
MCTPLSSVLYTTDGNVGVQHNVNFIYPLETISMKMDWLVQMMNNLALHSQISTQKSLQTTWYSGNIVFPVGRSQRLGIYALWLFWIHAIDCRMSGHYFMLKVTNCTCWIWIPVLGNHDYHGNVSAQVDHKVTSVTLGGIATIISNLSMTLATHLKVSAQHIWSDCSQFIMELELYFCVSTSLWQHLFSFVTLDHGFSTCIVIFIRMYCLILRLPFWGVTIWFWEMTRINRFAC